MVWVAGPVTASVVDWEGDVDVEDPAGGARWGSEDNEEGSAIDGGGRWETEKCGKLNLANDKVKWMRGAEWG